MSRTLTIDLTKTPPVIDSYAGEIGEHNAVTLEILTDNHEDVHSYVMYFEVEDGILPSSVYDADRLIEIPLTEDLTQREILTCQLQGVSADGTSIITKSPIIKLYLGESLTGDIVTDPQTGETIFTEIAELKSIAESLNMAQYYKKTETYSKTEVDAELVKKANVSSTYTTIQVNNLLSAKADKTDVYTKTETNTLLNGKAAANHNHDASYYQKSEVDTKLFAKADKTALDTKADKTALDSKQDKLTAGTNITIENNVISSTGGGSGDCKVIDILDDPNTFSLKYTPSEIEELMIEGNILTLMGYPIIGTQVSGGVVSFYFIVQYDTKPMATLYSFGEDKQIAGEPIQFYLGYTNDEKKSTLLDNKQDKLTAGTNISINGNVISANISSLPIASASAVGGIKVGDNLTIADDGTLSASGGECAVVVVDDSVTWDELITALDDEKLIVYINVGDIFVATRKTTSSIYFSSPMRTYSTKNIDGETVIYSKSESYKVFKKSGGWQDAVTVSIPTIDGLVQTAEFEDSGYDITSTPNKRVFSVDTIQTYYALKDDVPTVDNTLADSPNAISNSAVNTAIGDIESLLEAML